MEGDRKLNWAEEHMAVLKKIGENFSVKKPLKDLKIGMALHVEAKTGILALTLQRGGAEIRLASCNPLSTDDDVVSALKHRGIDVYARKGESREEYYENLHRVLEFEPDIIIDDGGDLTTLLHTQYTHIDIKGGSEETTTGVMRLKIMEKKGILRFPMFDVNHAKNEASVR